MPRKASRHLSRYTSPNPENARSPNAHTIKSPIAGIKSEVGESSACMVPTPGSVTSVTRPFQEATATCVPGANFTHTSVAVVISMV